MRSKICPRCKLVTPEKSTKCPSCGRSLSGVRAEKSAASGYGDRVAVQNGDDKLSYTELFDASGVVAAQLTAGGAERLAVLEERTSPALDFPLAAGLWLELHQLERDL